MGLKAVYGISMLDMFGLGLLMPALGPHLLQMGASNFIVGALGSCFALLQLITNPIAGSLSDVEGRKQILVKTLALNIASNVCFVFLSSSVFGLFISRILCGISNQNMVLLKALIADSVPPGEQTAVFGKMGALGALGFIAGPLIGGIVLDRSNGFFYLTLILTALSVASWAMGLLLPDTEPTKKKDSTKQSKDSSVFSKGYSELAQTISNITSIDWDTFGDVFTIKFLADISFHMFHSAFALVLQENLGLSHKEIGYVLAIYGIIGVISNILTAPVTKKLYVNDVNGKGRLLTVFTLCSIGYIGVGFAPSITIYVVSLAMLGSVRPLLETTATEQLVKRTHENDKGTILGTFESLCSLSGLIVPLISGIIIDFWNSTAPVLLCTLPAFIAIYMVNNAKEQKTHRE